MDETGLTINNQDYFEMPGLNVLVYHNTFSEGHQGGVEIIQHGERVATNGELRLSPTPGQWQPVPQIGDGYQHIGVAPQQIGLKARKVDRAANTISVSCHYPDPDRSLRGFNPLIYPKLHIDYTVRVQAEGQSFTITVDLRRPLPKEWVGRVGYSLELFPGDLYGKMFYMDGRPGMFPRQAGGPTWKNKDGEAEPVPMAEGSKLVVTPESEQFRMTIESRTAPLQLIDGSLKHNNGWFVVHSLVPAGAAKGAVQWEITPYVVADWRYPPVIHVSQIGYHPRQKKIAYIELDNRETEPCAAALHRILPSGDFRTLIDRRPALWGPFLRYQYATFDFSEAAEDGVYVITYGDTVSNPFRIARDVYRRDVWQPTLEYFLPMQMCHMRVNQKYRVWHGACHMDDALMAPPKIRHFDGYGNADERPVEVPFKPLQHIPGLDSGGWHDAGDDDVRTATQVHTIMALAHIYEEFGVDYDETLIDQENRHVEIHQPDGKPDLLQQIEHGVIWLLNYYRAFGSMGVGVIVPTLRQYVHLGDTSTQTDNKVAKASAARRRAAKLQGLWYKKVANRYSKVFDPEENLDWIEEEVPDLDDRLAFAQDNPARQVFTAAGLALAARVLKRYDKDLAKECVRVAEELWLANKDRTEDDTLRVFEYGRTSGLEALKIHALAELILTTKKKKYLRELSCKGEEVMKHFGSSGWTLGRVLPLLDSEEFLHKIDDAAHAYRSQVEARRRESPFGCPMAHSEIVGMKQYFLHKGWPDIFSLDPLFAVLDFMLGCRPGKTVNSLVSGVGAHSPVIAYGFNRADWSYIPGGTFWNAVNLIHPDLAEDKVWPYLWQEREYITDAACRYMFTVIAADRLLEEQMGDTGEDAAESPRGSKADAGGSPPAG
ncbi:MAG: glycoside hydrolase family 9 protein [Anaerolineales bacterium]